MMIVPDPNKVGPGEISFHASKGEEYRLPALFGGANPNLSVRPKYADYLCGACGQSTNGRVLCDMVRANDNANILWCKCSCERQEPTVIIQKDGVLISQLPNGCEFTTHEKWPAEIVRLFEEGIKAYAATAFTASTMVCRKVLMACACDKGADDGKAFAFYVDYVTNTVLTYPAAKQAIEAIRKIGNEANHGIEFVGADDAKRAMKIVTYMLNAIYSFPTA